jgi:hypothetical protein
MIFGNVNGQSSVEKRDKISEIERYLQLSRRSNIAVFICD